MNRLIPLLVAAIAWVPSLSLPTLADEPAAANPDNPEQLKAAGQQQLEREISSMPSIGAHDIRDVVTFAIDDGDLVVRTGLDDTQGKSRVQVKDLPGFSTVMVQGKQEGNDGASGVRLFEFTHYSFNTPGAIKVQTSVFATVGYGLQLARMIERFGEDASIQFIQMRRFGGLEELIGDEGVTLYVQVINNLTDRTTVDLKLSAPNIIELRRLYPQETAEYLQPIFRDLGQDATVFAIDPRLAWQVFADAYKPDDAVKAKVDAIVPKLDSDDFAQREDALANLQKLGQQAALYLMNADRSTFSAEQNSLIDTFLAEYQPVSQAEAQKLRTNVGFLLDCLYSDDQTIRTRALSALEEVAGQKLTFDVTAPAVDRLAAITKIRDTLLGPPPATTQPAETTEDPSPAPQ